jgi:hypothetical protein
MLLPEKGHYRDSDQTFLLAFFQFSISPRLLARGKPPKSIDDDEEEEKTSTAKNESEAQKVIAY